MNIRNLEKCFYEASQQGKKYVGVKVQMQGFPKSEIIINENENFDSKFDYYKKSYNEDLTLKAFSGIKIIGFTYGNSFQEIENDLTDGLEIVDKGQDIDNDSTDFYKNRFNKVN